MSEQGRTTTSKIIMWLVASVAVLFGLMTIKSGGQVLFGDESYRVAAGNYVAFVLWFNFMAGFAYLVAGIAIAARKSWSVWLALLIAISTLLVFVALGLHVLAEGAYETRTVAAMTLRSTVWVVISVLLYRNYRKGVFNVE